MKQLFIIVIVFIAISCKKDVDNPPIPEPEKPDYRLVLTCKDYKLDTLFLRGGYIIHYRCIESKIDTIR